MPDLLTDTERDEVIALIKERGLSDPLIKRLGPCSERYEVSDTGQGAAAGLRLRVFLKDAKTEKRWSYWYRNAAGETRRYPIGSYPGVTLSAARDEARDLAGRVRKGQDPAAERRKTREDHRARKAAPTLADVCDDFIADQSPEWRPSTRRGWVRFIEVEIKPVLGKKRPDEITPDDVRDLIARIERGVPGKRKAAPVSARRCFEVIRRLCAWAVWKRHMSLSPCEAARPFERSKKSGKRKASGRYKAYTDDQLRAVFAATKGTEVEHLVELVARTGVRSHEARSARWEDINLDRALWRVPPEMHKIGDDTGEARLVTLSPGAIRAFKAASKANEAAGYGASPWVFPARTKACEVCEREGHADKPNKATAAVKKAAGISDRGLLHRFRDTIKTRLSEHGIDGRVSEHILGHTVPGIAGTYDHAEMLPQRRDALRWWDGELTSIVAGKRRAKVVRLDRFVQPVGSIKVKPA